MVGVPFHNFLFRMGGWFFSGSPLSLSCTNGDVLSIYILNFRFGIRKSDAPAKSIHFV